jgi:hypothetical protein
MKTTSDSRFVAREVVVVADVSKARKTAYGGVLVQGTGEQAGGWLLTRYPPILIVGIGRHMWDVSVSFTVLVGHVELRVVGVLSRWLRGDWAGRGSQGDARRVETWKAVNTVTWHYG